MLNRIAMVLALFGVFVAGVLSYSHGSKTEVPCAADGKVDCARVINSPAGELMGIPVAYLGLAVYLILFGLAWYRVKATGKNWSLSANSALILTGIGFGFHLYLQVVSLMMLGQLCVWCLTSAVNMLIAFLVHGMLAQKGEPAEEREPKKDLAVAAMAVVLAVGAFGVTTTQMTKAVSPVSEIKSGVPLAEIMPIEAKMKGAPDAKIVVIEFADMLCPTCRKTYPDFTELFKKNVTKMRIGFRQFPLVQLPGHETALHAAMIAEFAAEKNLFWEFVDKAYDEANGERVKSVAGLLEIGREAGLDLEEMRPLVTKTTEQGNGRLLNKVNDDFYLAAERLKIKGTPTFLLIVNGGEPRALSFEELKRAMDEPEIKALLK